MGVNGMIIEYLPTNKIVIDGVVIKFNESRKSVRNKLSSSYKEDNQSIQMVENMEPVYQRRDIYQDLNSTENLFFLGYDKNDLLSEVEVHQCDQIIVLNTPFNFNDELDFIASSLHKSTTTARRNEGEYFFKELRVLIADKQQMGGKGNTLGYFYCAADVTHLE